MSDSDGGRRSLGDELFNTGWQQGTFFRAPSACFTLNQLSGSEPDVQIIRKERPTGSEEKFVLITQDCDIVASDDLEPYVEALLCKHEKQRFVNKIGSNSIRWFVIDRNAGLVAYARYRTQFDKKALTKLIPEPWPVGSNRFDEFVRWLARCYDRPAIPDPIYEALQRPLDARIAFLEEENPDIFAAFNRVVGDVRVKLPSSEKPPFDLQLILLISSDNLSEEEANAIDYFENIARDCLDTNFVHLHPEIRKVTEEMISMKEFYVSRPIYLGDYTYRGEEVEGARPHERI